MRRPSPIVWLLLAGVLVATVLVAIGRDDEGGYLDPRGTSPDGARAVIELVEALGGDARIVRGVPPAAADTALVLRDDALEQEGDALVAWVRAGGRLVIADPASPRTPTVTGYDAVTPGAAEADWLELEPGACDVGALDAVARLALREAVSYAVAEGDGSCFGSGGSAFVVERSIGTGTLVAVGGPDLFLNAPLDSADNAVLAAALLVPSPGTRFVFVEGFVGGVAGAGDASLWELVASSVRWALLLLAVAGVVFALGRARRLGRPVPEPLPVELRGSELVVAVGAALERNGEAAAAADRIRAEAQRRIAIRHGLPPEVPTHVLATVVGERHHLGSEEVTAALTPTGGAPSLLATADAVDRLERRVLDPGAPATRTAAPDPPSSHNEEDRAP